MPSPPAPAVPAFAPPPSLGVRAFGGGNSLGLNLLSGGALGYNMWGAPAQPPGGARRAGAGGGFVGSFFDGGGDDPLEPPAGPGPGPDVGTNRDGRTNAKTQESSDLDAETEWSKHNKGLLDDLGLD